MRVPWQCICTGSKVWGVTNGDHTTLRGAGGQRVRRTKLYTHTGRREHDGPTVVGTTCRPVTVSHVVPTYSTYVTHSRHLHTTVRVSYLRPTSYGVARVPLDTLLPTHPPTRAHRNNHPPLERRTHPYQTFCRCSAKRLPLLLPAELSSLDGRRHHIPAQAGSIGCGASSSGDAQSAVCICTSSRISRSQLCNCTAAPYYAARRDPP